jgi:hypothetical protein
MFRYLMKKGRTPFRMWLIRRLMIVGSFKHDLLWDFNLRWIDQVFFGGTFGIVHRSSSSFSNHYVRKTLYFCFGKSFTWL